jgi:hypothetical protein
MELAPRENAYIDMELANEIAMDDCQKSTEGPWEHMPNDNRMSSLNLRNSDMLKKQASDNMTSWGQGNEKRIKQKERFFCFVLGKRHKSIDL